MSTGEDPAKLRALKDAADKGWADVAAGRFTFVADGDLDVFIVELGARAAALRPSAVSCAHAGRGQLRHRQDAK